MNKGLVLAFAAGLLTGGLAVYFFMTKKKVEVDELSDEAKNETEEKIFEEEHLYDAGAPYEERMLDPTADGPYVSPVFDINGNPYQRIFDREGCNTGVVYGHAPKPFIENTHISGDENLQNHRMWDSLWYLGRANEIGDIWDNQGLYEELDDYDRFEYVYSPEEGVLYTIVNATYTVYADNRPLNYAVEEADDERNLFGFIFEDTFEEPSCDHIYLSNEKSFIALIHVREVYDYERED